MLATKLTFDLTKNLYIAYLRIDPKFQTKSTCPVTAIQRLHWRLDQLNLPYRRLPMERNTTDTTFETIPVMGKFKLRDTYYQKVGANKAINLVTKKAVTLGSLVKVEEL